jgi:hypothetical protein
MASVTNADAHARSVIGRAVPRLDAWRRSPTGPASEGGSYKEWMHFCVALPGTLAGHLLVNLNVTETGGGPAARRAPRLVVLAERGGWTGALETFDDAAVSGPAGGLDLRLGHNVLRWRDGVYRLSLSMEGLTAELSLRPLTAPTTATRVSFGPGRSIQWVVVPRLAADGWVRVAGETIALRGAPGYHDHNWGHFRWGGDLSWEWGFVNPVDPACAYSAVFVRVSDRGRHRTLSQALLLWRGDQLVRAFQDREVTTTLSGTHLGPRPFTLPKAAALLAPGTSTGVPARLAMEGRGADDHARVQYDTASKARLAIPSDVEPLGLVLLNETTGLARVEGRLGAEGFAFEGPAMMEFVRG